LICCANCWAVFLFCSKRNHSQMLE
jgi:hypothetical protein